MVSMLHRSLVGFQGQFKIYKRVELNHFLSNIPVTHNCVVKVNPDILSMSAKDTSDFKL